MTTHLDDEGVRDPGFRFGAEYLLTRDPPVLIHQVQPVREHIAAQPAVPPPDQQLRTDMVMILILYIHAPQTGLKVLSALKSFRPRGCSKETAT